MIKTFLVAASILSASPALSAGTSAAMSSGGMVSLSLIEALAAIRAPNLAGLFSFIAEKDAPFAFSDLLARDHKAMKRYFEKLADDREAANGLTAWDHEVCASLVNLYASPMGGTFGKPSAKILSRINECVLAPVVPLQEIVARRKR